MRTIGGFIHSLKRCFWISRPIGRCCIMAVFKHVKTVTHIDTRLELSPGPQRMFCHCWRTAVYFPQFPCVYLTQIPNYISSSKWPFISQKEVSQCHYLWWICAVVFFVCLLFFQSCTEKLDGWGFPSPELLTQTHLQQIGNQRLLKSPGFHTTCCQMMLSVLGYMATARAHLFKSFLVFISVYLNKRSNLVLLILPSLIYIVFIFCKSKAKYTLVKIRCRMDPV